MKFSGFVKKALLVIFFGMIFVSFSLWGVGDILRGGGGQTVVATVGDSEITQDDYNRRFSSELRRIQRQFGGSFTIENAQAIGLPRSVLDRMISQRLFIEQARQMGLAVSDDQVREQTYGTPAFQDELGQFSQARFNEVLRQLSQTQEQFAETMRRDIKLSQLTRAISNGVAAPRAMIEQAYAFQNEQRVAAFVRIPKSSIEIEEAATEADLESYHEDFSESFMAPALRDVTVVTVTPEEMAESIEVSEEALREEYEASKGDLGVPEKRKLEQALFDTEEEAQAFFEQLSGGQRFDAALEAFNGEEPIDFETVSRTELSVLLPDGVDIAFDLDAGEVSEPFEDQVGWHVLHVQEVIPGRTPEFEEVEDQLREDLTMHQAVGEMNELANEINDMLASGADLEAVADRLNLSIQSFDAISQDGKNRAGEAVSGLPSPNRFLDVAFSTEVGEQSLLTDTEDGGFFVLRVDGVTPPEVRPLSEVRAEVERAWLRDQREQKARELAEGYVEQLGSGTTLEEIAEQEGRSVQQTDALTRNGQQPSPEFVSQLFSVEADGAFSAGGQQAIYVAQLREIQKPDPGANPQAVEEIASRLNQGLSGDLLALYSNDLQQRYGVEINQAAVEDVVSRY